MFGSSIVAEAQVATSTILGVAPQATVTYGVPQAFTATVMSGASTVTAGTITFTDNSANQVIGKLALNGSGQATATVVLSAGAHAIQATYNPDPAHTGSSDTA